MSIEEFKEHRHRPPHLFRTQSFYLVTGATLKKQLFLQSNAKKENLLTTLQQRAHEYGWKIYAWAILDNHYHFVGEAPEDARSLKELIRSAHSINAKFVNREDGVTGRRIWYNYWDTCITAERAYLARLHYVNVNPVKHGYVNRPQDYQFCSYAWFVNSLDPEFNERVFNQPIDEVRVRDDF